MGYTGCALIAQSIRDAMNRSNTTSIDRIISEYQYYGSTAYAPNQDVKDAVSFIFDQNGSAVQHRVLCFYVGAGVILRETLMEKKKYGWLNHVLIIAGRIVFVKRIFVLENMRTCIV